MRELAGKGVDLGEREVTRGKIWLDQPKRHAAGQPTGSYPRLADVTKILGHNFQPNIASLER
jgi:hypothetical protein